MPSPEEKEIIISAGALGTPDKRIKSPEELAQRKIYLHGSEIERVWGPGAIERYTQALPKPRRIHPCAPTRIIQEKLQKMVGHRA